MSPGRDSLALRETRERVGIRRDREATIDAARRLPDNR